MVNNAGIFVPKPFTEYTTEDFGRVVSTNLAGLSQEAARHMRQRGGGTFLRSQRRWRSSRWRESTLL
jgi:NAD(P)-dependent dehydrogenase (short-subunit alcohol dehydrogenase family)